MSFFALLGFLGFCGFCQRSSCDSVMEMSDCCALPFLTAGHTLSAVMGVVALAAHLGRTALGTSLQNGSGLLASGHTLAAPSSSIA